YAVRKGHRDATFALLEGGADVNQQTADGSTPLLAASVNGYWDLAMDLLVHYGADPRIANDAAATPLYAVINLQWAPKTFYPQPTAHRQQQVNYLGLMETLLEAGADPNVRLEKEL